MMLIATMNIGEAKVFRERPPDCWIRFEEPTNRTIEPAAIPSIYLVMSRYIGSRFFPNSPSTPHGARLKGEDLVLRRTMSHTRASSPSEVAIPGKPGRNMHQVYLFCRLAR